MKSLLKTKKPMADGRPGELSPALLSELAVMHLRDRAALRVRLRDLGFRTLGARMAAELSIGKHAESSSCPAALEALPDDLLLLVVARVRCAKATVAWPMLSKRFHHAFARDDNFWRIALSTSWSHSCWENLAGSRRVEEHGVCEKDGDSWLASCDGKWVQLPVASTPRLFAALRDCDLSRGALPSPLLLLARDAAQAPPCLSSTLLLPRSASGGLAWASRPFWSPGMLRRAASLVRQLRQGMAAVGDVGDDDDEEEDKEEEPCIPAQVAEAIGRARPHAVGRKELRRFDACGGWPFALVLEQSTPRGTDPRGTGPGGGRVSALVACAAEAVPAGALVTEVLAEVSEASDGSAHRPREMWDADGTLRLDICETGRGGGEDGGEDGGVEGGVEGGEEEGGGEGGEVQGGLRIPLRLLYDMRRQACFARYVCQVYRAPPEPRGGDGGGGGAGGGAADAEGAGSAPCVNLELETGLGGPGAARGALRLLYRATKAIAPGDPLCCSPVSLLASRHAHRRAAEEPAAVRESLSRPETENVLRPALQALAARKEAQGATGVYAMLVL
jgi:hypothetical protein